MSPSLEYAIEFVPRPTATHLVPFHATSSPLFKKIVFKVTPVQMSPSLEYVIEFGP